MSKTITMRVDDSVYDMLKTAAHGSKRSISNFIEYASVAYLSKEAFVDDDEMDQILKDKNLLKALSQAEKEIKRGKYSIVR